MEKINPLDQERLLGRRIGRIDDRPDLFETKLLLSKSDGLPVEESKNILVCTRDPGSANALIPVVEKIKEKASFYFLTDGWARNSIEQKFKTEDLSPPESMLLAYEAMPEPDLVLTDPSSSERGLENYAAGTFPQSPLVLVEDYYGVTNNALRRLKEIKKEPTKICVMDKFARDIVLKENPELKDKIAITGQPAFDKYAQEDTEKIYQETREKLGLKPEECLISFFSISGDQRELISQVAKKIKTLGDNVYFALRSHPRSVIKKDEYELLLKDSGIRTLGTDAFSSDQINAASDIIITTTSTEGLIGVYRQKPTIHILDKQYGGQNEALAPDYIPPPCLCGASELVLDINQLTEKIEPLLERESPARNNLIKNIRENFLIDGKSTERVAAEIENILENKK